MHLADIAKQVRKETSVDADTVRRVLRSFLDTLIKEMAAGNEVVVRGFGTFGTVVHKGRAYPNPRGGLVYKSDRTFPKFTFCDTLRVAFSTGTIRTKPAVKPAPASQDEV